MMENQRPKFGQNGNPTSNRSVFVRPTSYRLRSITNTLAIAAYFAQHVALDETKKVTKLEGMHFAREPEQQRLLSFGALTFSNQETVSSMLSDNPYKHVPLRPHGHLQSKNTDYTNSRSVATGKPSSAFQAYRTGLRDVAPYLGLQLPNWLNLCAIFDDNKSFQQNPANFPAVKCHTEDRNHAIKLDKLKRNPNREMLPPEYFEVRIERRGTRSNFRPPKSLLNLTTTSEPSRNFNVHRPSLQALTSALEEFNGFCSGLDEARQQRARSLSDRSETRTKKSLDTVGR